MKIKYLIAYGFAGILTALAACVVYLWTDHLDAMTLAGFMLAITYIFLGFNQNHINMYTNWSLFFWFFLFIAVYILQITENGIVLGVFSVILLVIGIIKGQVKSEKIVL